MSDPFATEARCYERHSKKDGSEVVNKHCMIFAARTGRTFFYEIATFYHGKKPDGTPAVTCYISSMNNPKYADQLAALTVEYGSPTVEKKIHKANT